MAEHYTRIKKILVPVDGSGASLEAVAVACNLGRRNKGTVYAVYVIEVSRSLPLDAELDSEARDGEGVLALADEVADEHDFKVEGEILQARDAGHAIVDEAIERGVAAIVMGVQLQDESPAFEWPQHGKPKALATDLKLGHVADYVLHNAPCEVWLIRQPIGAR
ncbi:MAG TPA: universal stress protein [Dehalococcoidia bacterium]|nr:universal stress protein [Dehalococcoidia bacterium]